MRITQAAAVSALVLLVGAGELLAQSRSQHPSGGMSNARRQQIVDLRAKAQRLEEVAGYDQQKAREYAAAANEAAAEAPNWAARGKQAEAKRNYAAAKEAYAKQTFYERKAAKLRADADAAAKQGKTRVRQAANLRQQADALAQGR